MKQLIFVLIISSLFACSKDKKLLKTFLDCEQIETDYQPYAGEPLACHFHFVRTEYNNEQFIELNSHCADLNRPIVINENCRDIRETLPFDANSKCGKYQAGKEVIEILLIEK